MEFLDVGILKISDSELESSSRNSKNVGLRARTFESSCFPAWFLRFAFFLASCPLLKSKTQAPKIGAPTGRISVTILASKLGLRAYRAYMGSVGSPKFSSLQPSPARLNPWENMWVVL